MRARVAAAVAAMCLAIWTAPAAAGRWSITIPGGVHIESDNGDRLRVRIDEDGRTVKIDSRGRFELNHEEDMNIHTDLPDRPAARKLKVATTSLAGCFGCHTSFLDIDERILQLVEFIEFDRSPLTDIKHCGPCDIGIIEGAVANAENVHGLREFRKNCKVLVAIGACAINGGLPALRNQLDLAECLTRVYCDRAKGNQSVANNSELPLLLEAVSSGQ